MRWDSRHLVVTTVPLSHQGPDKETISVRREPTSHFLWWSSFIGLSAACVTAHKVFRLDVIMETFYYHEINYYQ